MNDTKRNKKKKIFDEIKGRIKLDDGLYLIEIKTMNIGPKLQQKVTTQ